MFESIFDVLDVNNFGTLWSSDDIIYKFLRFCLEVCRLLWQMVQTVSGQMRWQRLVKLCWFCGNIYWMFTNWIFYSNRFPHEISLEWDHCNIISDKISNNISSKCTAHYVNCLITELCIGEISNNTTLKVSRLTKEEVNVNHASVLLTLDWFKNLKTNLLNLSSRFWVILLQVDYRAQSLAIGIDIKTW